MRALILSTPLRYPGGKSKAVKDLYEYMPQMSQYDEWREPFLGGGSMSIEITKKFPDMKIWVNDLYPALFNFWTMVKDRGDEMTERLLEIKSECITSEIAKSFHIEQKKIINDDASSDFDKAVAFYYANKNSFSGLTETGTFSESSHEMTFTTTNIGKLTYFQKLIRNWKFTNGSYDVLLKDNNPKAFVYLDPPYELKDSTLYGKNGSMHLTFDHDEFAKNCNECGMDAMISYNADQFVKDRFDGWNQLELEWTYTMRSVGNYMEEQKGRKELVLTNYNIEQGSLEAFF
jgi:DNA adenine methylase Dam